MATGPAVARGPRHPASRAAGMVLHPRPRSSMNRCRLADCGRSPVLP
jgi:hypothetical protein